MTKGICRSRDKVAFLWLLFSFLAANFSIQNDIHIVCFFLLASFGITCSTKNQTGTSHFTVKQSHMKLVQYLQTPKRFVSAHLWPKHWSTNKCHCLVPSRGVDTEILSPHQYMDPDQQSASASVSKASLQSRIRSQSVHVQKVCCVGYFRWAFLLSSSLTEINNNS